VAAELTAPPKLAARGLRVRRGGREVLAIDALDVPAGRTLAVLGPNGAGKTTLLLQLALLERPDAGEVLFEGAPARGRELRLRRRMAVVFQQPLLLDRTALANVETGLRLRGVGRRERRARAERWLARLGVARVAGQAAHTLSGGEAQRVSLARAFALEPEVLFLDEPFSALDEPTRVALVEDLAALLAETRLTCVFVTHSQDEAARLAHEVVVLIGGEPRQVGPPEAVFTAPTDPEVAAFVGIGTMLAGRVLCREGGVVTLDAAGQRIEAVDERAFDEALVCLRPEDVTIAPAGQAGAGSARNHLRGRVRRIVRTGVDARVEVDCGAPVVARVTARSLAELGLAEGSEVVASFKATAVHLIPR